MVNPVFRHVLAEFNAHGVEFLVVGAHALAAYGLLSTPERDKALPPNSALQLSIAVMSVRAYEAGRRILERVDEASAVATQGAPSRITPGPP
jgi:hypothetical protein